MPVELYRIDDRLIHGQVCAGWGQPLDIGFIVLVNDDVAASEWEQDLYRVGAPVDMELFFETVEQGRQRLPLHQADHRPGIVLTSDISTMRRLLDGATGVSEVNLGGIHHRAGRTQRLRYVFLSAEEVDELRALEAAGIRVVARDVPSARAVGLDDLVGEGRGR